MPALAKTYIAAFVIACCASIYPAAAENRQALLIGISNYQHISPLKNTLNDTRMLAGKLAELGFEITKIEDPNLDDFRNSVLDFTFKAETAEIALIYYAGHGVESGGENFLIPADINVKDRSLVAPVAVSLEELLFAVDRARQLRIVILDSCRVDPFAKTADTQISISATNIGSRGAGLAAASPERGTLVAFAAEAGAVAFDGTGTNSPFVLAMNEHLGTPDLDIGLMFRRVRDSVLKATNNRQEPHTYGSLPGIPYFLAGSSQSVNKLADNARKHAWTRFAGTHEKALGALASSGDTRALLGLAYMRLNPDEKNYDPRQAFRLLEQAAEKNDPEGMYELGRLHEQGIGTKQDIDRALQLYRNAADANYADAINDLGFLYFQGGLGIKRNKKKAIALFGRAADLRHPQAMFNYAALIDDGIVAGKTPQDAAHYLYQALRSGSEDVLNQLLGNPKMFKKSTRIELQKRLAKVSLYDGKIDGQIGPATKKGLKRAYGIDG